MSYSYIKPREKSPLTPDIELMLTFFGVTIIMLILTYAFLLFKDYSFNKEKQNISKTQKKIQFELKDMKSKIVYIQKQRALSNKIFTQNTVLRDSITNLFDLVPQRITLSEAKLLKNGLILYGITPNKDVYNFMLEAPLRSIFYETYTSFYPADNGWLRFVSTNYIDPNSSEEIDSED